MKYFSLFSGIGGFELGIQRTYDRLCSPEYEEGLSGIQSQGNSPGITSKIRYPQAVGFSEIDKYATSIYKKHFPSHKEYGDVSNIKWSNVPDFELLCGGFPCQSFSIAGKRGGFSDTRGTLFFEIARCTQEKQPRLLFLENVKGLLSHDKGRTFGTILNTLDELGYDLQWQVLNSKNFGVPQNRERVFIVGHLRGTPRPQVFPITRCSQGITKGAGETPVIRTLTGGGHSGGHHSTMTLVKKMVPYEESQDQKLSQGISQSLNTGHYNQPKIGVINGKLDDGTLESKTGFQENRNMPSMQRKKENRISSQKRGLARPSTGEHPRDMSQLPQQNTSSQGKMQNLRQTNEGSKVLRETLSEVQKIRQSQDVQKKPAYSDYRIRRLTPLEAERLQGFPDGWTESGVDMKGNYVAISDTQRYRCLGNAVTVNVIEGIMKNLKFRPDSLRRI